MLRLAFDFIITWRETRTRPNAYLFSLPKVKYAFAPKRYNIDKTKCSLAIPV